MELPESCSDSEPKIAASVSGSEQKPDYFGLNSSSDDDDEVAHLREEMRRPLPIDTAINSFQLSECPIGPQLQRSEDIVFDSDEASHKNSQPRKWRKLKRQRIEPIDESPRFPIAALTEIQPDSDIFQPRLSIPGSTTVCRVPRLVGRTCLGHTGCVNALQWGMPHDVSHLLLSASMDGTLRIWDTLRKLAKTAVWTRRAHDGAAVRTARWCPLGRWVASGGYDKMVRVTDVEKGCEIFRGEHPDFVTSLKYCPDSNLVLTGTRGCVQCWDTRQEAQKATRNYEADFEEVQDIEFLPGGHEFICCSNLVSRDSTDKAIMAWDFRTGAILSNQIFRERYHCIQLRIHPSEACFMAQTTGNYVALFSTSRPYKMNTKKRLEGHKVEGYWTGFDVSPDGRYVYSGSADGLLYEYDFQRLRPLGTLRVSAEPCLAVVSHPVLGSTVATADWRGNVYVCQ